MKKNIHVNIVSYKSKVASRYIPIHPDHIGLKILESSFYYTSIKYDGYFAVLSIKDGTAVLQNGNEKILEIKPILEQAKKINENVVLVGELCLFKEGKSLSHRELSAALDEPDKYDIRFGVFDLMPSEDNQMELKEKVEKIKSLASSELIFPIAQQYSESRADIIAMYKQIEGKEEGLIVRTAENMTYKIKPEITLDLVVLGYALNAGADESLRELLLGMVDANAHFQLVTKCGNGFSEKERTTILETLKPLVVQSSYTEVSGAKTAFAMVEPKRVVELSCLDIITETSKGAIKKAVLTYTEKEGYALKEQALTVSCISPVFKRFRDDKKADVTDAGGQEFMDLLMEKSSTIQPETAPSEVFSRTVYAKKGKGGTAVRKFLGVETHKAETGNFAPFLVLYSDFSAGRKTPLDQDIFLCSSKQEVEEKITALIAENIKSGWEKV